MLRLQRCWEISSEALFVDAAAPCVAAEVAEGAGTSVVVRVQSPTSETAARATYLYD